MAVPETFFNIFPTWIGVYGLAITMFSISFILFYKRVITHISNSIYNLDFSNIETKFKNVLTNGLFQKKVLQRTSFTKDRSGIGHVIIFISFLSYALSYILFIFADSINSNFSKVVLGTFLKNLYLSYLEILAILVFIALITALIRRWILIPNRLKFSLTKKPESIIIIVLIASLMLTHLLTESVNHLIKPETAYSFNFISEYLSKPFKSLNYDINSYILLHDLFWWIHLTIILSFAVYIPISKHLHLLVSPMSFFFGNTKSSGIIDTPLNLEEMETFGANNLRTFKPKQIMDFFACAVCGRCSEVCPTNLTDKELSPMHFINNLMQSSSKTEEDLNIGVIDNQVSKTEIWDCLNCGACVNECPVGIEHISPIIDMRRHLVMEKSEMPKTAESTLLSLEQGGHPWRGTTFTRSDWHKDLNVKTISDNPDAEYLLWVGCTGALVERNQKVIKSLVKILNSANVNFAILSNEETCTGDPAKRIGNEYLFQILANQNIQNFIKYDIKKIITHCPHCLNTIKNEYPALGFKAEVINYTELITKLIDQKDLIPTNETSKTVSYHDPCFLGRHNKIYEEPRDIVDSIPGMKRMEMCKNKDKALCCGAGGGHMWIEESNEKRVSHLRTDEFLETKSDTLAVACPFCLQMFEEGISAKSQSDKEVKDIAELLEESIEENK
jgi:Fe-S oxidoreductase